MATLKETREGDSTPRAGSPSFGPGKRVWIKSGECCGTIVSAAEDGYDGDWWIASEGHGYQVVRYENEIELLPAEDSIPENAPSVPPERSAPDA